MCLVSCSDPINLNDGTEESLLVLEAVISPQQNKSTARLSTSVIINTSNQQFLYPKDDAVITIREKNQSVWYPFEFDASNEIYEEAELTIQPDKIYEISAIWPGTDYPEAFGEVKVPKETTIDSIDLITADSLVNANNIERFSKHFEVEITFEEPESYPSFFRIIPARRDWKQNMNEPPYLGSKDLVYFEDYSFIVGGNALHELEHIEGLLIDPSKLPDNKIRIAFSSNDLEINKDFIDTILFLFQTVDAEYYRYHLATSRQLKASSTPFSQPITSYSNISNGFGVFGSVSESMDSVLVK